MQHDRQSRIGQAAKDFLAFAQGITQQHRGLVVFDRFPAETNDPLQDFSRRREPVVAAAVSCLHDQDIGWSRFASFSGQALAQFEIAGVKQRFAAGFDKSHRAAEDVTGGKEGQMVRDIPMLERSPLAKRKNMFQPLAFHAGAHELGSGGAEDDFAMDADVIRMGVADKNAVFAQLRLMRVEPQAQLRQTNAAAHKTNSER